MPPYLFLLPALILLAALVYVPLVTGVYISLTGLNEYTLTRWLSAPFVGLSNYASGLNPHSPIGSTVLGSALTSVVFSGATTLGDLPLGIGAALLVHQRLPGRGVFRALFLLPYIVPTFVIALVWRLMFMNGWGLVDRLLGLVHPGWQNTYWLIGPNALPAMILADVWASWPFVYLMVLAGLQTIPEEILDAAAVDGADSWLRLRHVILPLLGPTLALTSLLSTIFHFNNFTLPYVLFGTSPPPDANVLPLNIYVNSFVTFNFGLGAAMSVISLLLMLTPAVFYLRAAAGRSP